MQPVLPTHLVMKPAGRSTYTPAGFGWDGFYYGEVKAVVPVSDKRNQSKKQEEYQVEITVRDGLGVVTTVMAVCRVADMFGSGDTYAHSLRTASQKSVDVSDGAQVIVAFVSGDFSQGVIIGALRNTAQANNSLLGRFLKWVFNGVVVNINDDGELRLRVNGATKNDGTPDTREDTNQGPYVQFTKDGSFYVTDNNGQSITVNPREKAVRILAQEQSQINAKRVQIGSQTANENLVLGQSMVQALNELLDLFLKNPQIGKAAGPNVILDPVLAANLLKWKIKWVTNIPGPAKILSAKAYTER